MIIRWILLTLLIVVPALAIAGGGKKPKNDHEEARAALSRGEILPLTRVLEISSELAPGNIIEVELEDKPLVYKLKVLADDGRVRKLKLDARTGVMIKREDD